jgi:hypothetical protein
MTRTILLALSCCLSIAATDCYAQGVDDMWTRDMEQRGLFTPHENNCDSTTEAFVAIAGSSRGFCIEKAVRSADYWENARESCAALGMRLPELAEYKVTCAQAGALGVSMPVSSNREWLSNFPALATPDYGEGPAAYTALPGSCHSISFDFVASNWTPSTRQWSFRCVR